MATTTHPDWVIVRGNARRWDWYNEQTTTELAWIDDDGCDRRIVVADGSRRVIRSWSSGQPDAGWASLYGVAGVVSRFFGRDAYGHTDWLVA